MNTMPKPEMNVMDIAVCMSKVGCSVDITI
jgi:hypothetical protein